MWTPSSNVTRRPRPSAARSMAVAAGGGRLAWMRSQKLTKVDVPSAQRTVKDICMGILPQGLPLGSELSRRGGLWRPAVDDLPEGVHDRGVEVRAAELLDDLERATRGHRGLVRPRRGAGVIGVRGGDDACDERNLIASE